MRNTVNIKNMDLGLESSSPIVSKLQMEINDTLKEAQTGLESLNSSSTISDIEASQLKLKSLQSKSFLNGLKDSGYIHPFSSGFECFNSDLKARIECTKRAYENIISECKKLLNQN